MSQKRDRRHVLTLEAQRLHLKTARTEREARFGWDPEQARADGEREVAAIVKKRCARYSGRGWGACYNNTYESEYRRRGRYWGRRGPAGKTQADAAYWKRWWQAKYPDRVLPSGPSPHERRLHTQSTLLATQWWADAARRAVRVAVLRAGLVRRRRRFGSRRLRADD
jgi:hypothetical protein